MKKETCGALPALKLPSARHLEWFSRNMSAFLHFGPNTFTTREWGDGTDAPSIFNPTELDTRQWVRVLKEAGFSCAILTAKHHDGFCLWQTAYTDYSVRSSPYKNGKGDVVREFTDACREYGMKAGIYLSPWDRHESTWGTDAYNDYYVGQLTELLTSYGPIHEVWWDGAGSKDAVYDWERWGNTVRTLAPNAVIFGSRGATPFVDVRWVGNEKGVAGIPCYATLRRESLLDEVVAELNVGDPHGELFVPAEVDVSIRPGWFYKEEQNDFVRSAENLFALYLSSIGRGAGLLLNVPPDTRGLLHERDVASLVGLRAYLDKSTEKNLAEDGVLSIDSHTSPELTLPYVANEEKPTPTLTYTFSSEIQLNTVFIKEDMSLGQRIMGVEVCALIDGEWKSLFTSPCVGNTCIRQFDTVKTQAVRVRVTEAVAPAAVNFIGLYLFDEFKEQRPAAAVGSNLLTRVGASATREGNEITLELGGVYPFNYFRMDGTDLQEFTLEVFNGSSYEHVVTKKTYYDMPAEHAFSEAVDYAYRLRVTVKEAKHNEILDRKPELTLL